ncbi:MAG: hypothetical protein PHG90_00365 [Clostridia bacterium]|nr:hypothetical protein [Clostridia bacterium]
MALILLKINPFSTDELIADAFSLYNKLFNPEYIFSSSVNIFRKDGKPSVEGFQGYISVSHSDNIYACIIDNNPVGIDVEKHRDLDFSKISKRFFGQIINNKLDFYEHWCKAESIAKSRNTPLINALKMDLEREAKVMDIFENMTMCYYSCSTTILYFQQ